MPTERCDVQETPHGRRLEEQRLLHKYSIQIFAQNAHPLLLERPAWRAGRRNSLRDYPPLSGGTRTALNFDDLTHRQFYQDVIAYLVFARWLLWGWHAGNVPFTRRFLQMLYFWLPVGSDIIDGHVNGRFRCWRLVRFESHLRHKRGTTGF